MSQTLEAPEGLHEKNPYKAAAARLRFRTDALINGEFVKAASGKTFATENPATGKIITHIAECDAADVDRAVHAARKSFESGVWSRMKPSDRKKVLLKWADLLEANLQEIALLDSLEGGKPIGDCINMDIPDTIHCIRWHAEVTDKMYDRVSPTGPENLAMIVREPMGVVGCVIPWNFPAQMAAWKLGPALAGGNSIVLKPAEQTSLSAIRMAELALEAGVPAGVLNIIPGFGPTAGQAIGRHMDINMVAFTGSGEVGKMFLKYSAETNMKRISLECGGKSPQLVFADAPDLDTVANNAVSAAFWNMGENCSCGSRLIVHKSIKDQLVEKIAKIAGEWTIGDPIDPMTRVGSMIEKPHMERVMSYIAAGKQQGARLVMGGKQVRQDSGGYFVEVTIFDEVNNDMRIAREEIFGPVLSVISFNTEEEGIKIANDTNFGLAASLYTRDLNTAHRAARAIKAGTVSVNCFSEGDIGTPFGGFKESGFGGRDKSIFAHEQYTELKTIWMQLA
ncbi:MAG TPA: aldehyde dehydrogenase [Phycisphaerae bacterium]|nr:aldehyde dehydrogenase [Phycisphaerae bacterium]